MAEGDPKNFDGWAHTHTDRAIYQDIKERARFMRRNPTPAEQVLWRRLRGRQIGGFHFRRQHPISRFIVDFYCAAAWLVIEIDGSIHDAAEQREYDAARQAHLEEVGLRVLRFSNAAVINKSDAVVEVIAESVGCMG